MSLSTLTFLKSNKKSKLSKAIKWVLLRKFEFLTILLLAVSLLTYLLFTAIDILKNCFKSLETFQCLLGGLLNKQTGTFVFGKNLNETSKVARKCAHLQTMHSGFFHIFCFASKHHTLGKMTS